MRGIGSAAMSRPKCRRALLLGSRIAHGRKNELEMKWGVARLVVVSMRMKGSMGNHGNRSWCLIVIIKPS